MYYHLQNALKAGPEAIIYQREKTGDKHLGLLLKKRVMTNFPNLGRHKWEQHELTAV